MEKAVNLGFFKHLTLEDSAKPWTGAAKSHGQDFGTGSTDGNGLRPLPGTSQPSQGTAHPRNATGWRIEGSGLVEMAASANSSIHKLSLRR